MTGPWWWPRRWLSRHRRRALDSHWADVQELLARDQHPAGASQPHPLTCACTTCLLWWSMIYSPSSGLDEIGHRR